MTVTARTDPQPLPAQLPPETPQEKSVRRAVKTQQMVGRAIACQLCPGVTPEQGIAILGMRPRPDTVVPLPAASLSLAEAMVDDEIWRGKLAAWLAAYWAAHDHGPTWKTFWAEAPLWPGECPVTVQRAVMRFLGSRKIVDGMRTPFGLRMREAAPVGAQKPQSPAVAR